MAKRINNQMGRIERVVAAVAVLAVLTGLAALSPALAATTYYVDKANASCTDSGSGSVAQPFCSIGRGAEVAQAGDSVLVGT
ncbi:MAG TPA: hypothetical protein VM841_10795, partial [Actinomycetota bacterium]|nr:hypothetical protein [Actinomycetota bacterium]